ncbi:hypothetical protein D3093_32520 (plasmid) [Azospirillum argentinense]|uniref:Uncharacterized protein n=1 Tax=Azospirillum argentinense TaxID=2970906 RepID=A0A4D8PZG4_9PROT|nr:Pnap_2097 family protein [Azospirillum argentinense]QCN99959.1 hypothetical protein D3093_32520 [Azospirillum argentinense]
MHLIEKLQDIRLGDDVGYSRTLPERMPIPLGVVMGMPQILSGAMSERWLAKEAGDIHWRMICNDLGVPSQAILDRSADRLYASFLRMRIVASGHLAEFGEGDALAVHPALSRFGDRRYFSETTFSKPEASVRVSMVSAFVARHTDNKDLARSAPLGMERARSLQHHVLPPLGQQYQQVKARALDGMALVSGPALVLGGHPFHWTEDSLFTLEHEVDPYCDLNGVGLLYFASYHRIADIGERAFFNAEAGAEVGQLERGDDWALASVTCARDVFYYGNADAGERLTYVLRSREWLDGQRVATMATLLRNSDGVRIADLFTIKQLVRPSSAHAFHWLGKP